MRVSVPDIYLRFSTKNMSTPPQASWPKDFRALNPKRFSTEAIFERCNLPPQLSLVTQSIPDEQLRKLVEKVLANLVFLLDYLSLVGDTAAQSTSVDDIVSILNGARDEATLLLDFIETQALYVKELDDTTRQSFDGIAYAIGHDLKRTFELERYGLKQARPIQEIYATLFDAQGLLRNCFQHCIINLVQVFDHSITAQRLFDDWRIRKQRSLLLCEELTALIRILHSESAHSLEYIAQQLKIFRDGSMRWLMYKDWQEYETLSGRVLDAINLGDRPSELLHQLECYMETLLTQVKVRSVLSDSDPVESSVQRQVVFT